MLDRFCLEKYFIENHKISSVIVRQYNALVLNHVFSFPGKRDCCLSEFILQSILINNFVMSLSEFSMDLHAAADDFKGLLLVENIFAALLVVRPFQHQEF